MGNSKKGRRIAQHRREREQVVSLLVQLGFEDDTAREMVRCISAKTVRRIMDEYAPAHSPLRQVELLTMEVEQGDEDGATEESTG